MRYKDGIKKTTQVKVKGYDHNPGAGDGALEESGCCCAAWRSPMGSMPTTVFSGWTAPAFSRTENKKARWRPEKRNLSLWGNIC